MLTRTSPEYLRGIDEPEAADLIESLQARVKELEAERDAFRAARDYEKEAHQRTIKNHDRHYNIAHCGSVDSFLACDDEVKRAYFAMMVEESSDNKKLRERIAELEHDAELMSKAYGLLNADLASLRQKIEE